MGLILKKAYILPNTNKDGDSSIGTSLGKIIIKVHQILRFEYPTF